MTAHAHDHPTQAARSATGSARPRWLLPALVGGVVVGALVVSGVLSPTAALYGGLIGGMLLMHAGGHGGGSGQGSHGGHGGGAGGPTSDDVDLSRRSLSSQPSPSGSGERFDDRAPNDPSGSETNDHDQRSSQSCH